MNKKTLPFALVALGLVLSSCGENISSSSQSSSEQSSSSTSSKEIVSVTLDEAIANTTNYGISTPSSIDKGFFYEINASNIFYYAPNEIGYVEVPEDKGYLHDFTVSDYDNEKSYIMDVGGRYGASSTISQYRKTTFIDAIIAHKDQFKKVDTNFFVCTSSYFTTEIADYLQSKLAKYATYFELEADDNGFLSSLRLYEIISGEYSLLSELVITPMEVTSYKAYQNWKKEGVKFDFHIINLKMLKDPDNFMAYSCYEDEEVTFDAYYIGSVDGSIIVSEKSDYYGPIGIKVSSDSFPLLELNTKVKVTGTVKTNDMCASIENATIISYDEKSPYPYIFDEESAADYNGAGVYATNFFYGVPYYQGSIYSTYALINKEVIENNNEAIISLQFPAFISQGGGSFEVNLGVEKNNANYDSIVSFAKENVNSGKELSLQNLFVRFNSSAANPLSFLATDQTSIGYKLTPAEKIKERVGMDNFPLPETETFISYKIGNDCQGRVEEVYDIPSQDYEGVYVAAITDNEITLDSYVSTLLSSGASIVDYVKDASTTKHAILSFPGSIVVDVMTQVANIGYVTNIWVYKGEPIVGEGIKGRLSKVLGPSFNSDEFIKLGSTYDAEYSIFEIEHYSTVDFSSKMTIVTIDTQTNVYDDYVQAIVDKGDFKTVRRDDGRPLSYKSRGKTHTIFKDSSGYYLDIAVYPTSDYTYTGHKTFNYRIELLIYKADAPFTLTLGDSLDLVQAEYKGMNPDMVIDYALPEGTQVETWLDHMDFNNVYFGYNGRNEAFIYTSKLDEVFDGLCAALVEKGYQKQGNTTSANRAYYTKTVGKDMFCYLIMKEPDKGYIRFIAGFGGLDFF